MFKKLLEILGAGPKSIEPTAILEAKAPSAPSAEQVTQIDAAGKASLLDVIALRLKERAPEYVFIGGEYNFVQEHGGVVVTKIDVMATQVELKIVRHVGFFAKGSDGLRFFGSGYMAETRDQALEVFRGMGFSAINSRISGEYSAANKPSNADLKIAGFSGSEERFSLGEFIVERELFLSTLGISEQAELAQRDARIAKANELGVVLG